MSDNRVYSSRREGIWMSPRFSRYENLTFWFKKADKAFNQYSIKHKRLINDNITIDEYRYLISEIKNNFHKYELNCLIHCCIYIEGLINKIGIIKLGNKFYKENIEKINPVSRKIKVLVGICYGEIIRSKNDAIENVQKMFNERNQYIHPKTKEVDDIEHSTSYSIYEVPLKKFIFNISNSNILEWKKSVDSFINFLKSLDADIRIL